METEAVITHGVNFSHVLLVSGHEVAVAGKASW
jgi:hypothetical protein